MSLVTHVWSGFVTNYCCRNAYFDIFDNEMCRNINFFYDFYDVTTFVKLEVFCMILVVITYGIWVNH